MLDADNVNELVHGMTVSQQTLDIFYLFLFPAIAVFMIGFAAKLYFWTRGGRPFKIKIPLWTLVKTFIFNVLLQRQVLDLSVLRWVIHMAIFWGFLGLFGMSGIDFFLYEIIVIDDQTFLSFDILWFNSQEMFPQGLWVFVKGFANELFGFILLFGVIAAMVRRFIARPEQLLSKYMDVVSLLWLFVMAISGFLMEGVRMIAQGDVGLENFELGGWLCAQGFLAFGYTAEILTQSVYDLTWFFHIGVAILFLVYSPFSKMVHVITSPVIDYVNNVEEELEDEHITEHVPFTEVIDDRVLSRLPEKERGTGRR
jgi:nitrate reductase gamma subunit